MLNQEWEIKQRSAACRQCGQAFANGQTYVSSLRVNGADYERVDCCENCWNDGKFAADSFSSWRGVFQAEPPPPEVLKKETAESLLRRLIEKNDPQYRNSIFILAVMLERRRILAEKEVRPQEGDLVLRVYEHRQTGETFIIGDPVLSLDQLEHVQSEVANLLSGSEALAAEVK